MPGCVRQPEGLAGAVLGRLALGAVPCQQAARGIRRAAYARHPRQLRRHPPAPDVHHLPPLLRTDARFRRAGRVPVRGGDADLCRASQLPLYALIWRFINSYATVITGSLLFWYWLRRGLVGRE